MSESFEYIIVGGGTAGLVVASRLAEDKDVKVLVVEAGDDRKDDPLILTPGMMAKNYGIDEYDWNFLSTPQVSEGSICYGSRVSDCPEMAGNQVLNRT